MGVFSWLKGRHRLPPTGRERVARYADERGPVGFIRGAVPDGAVVPDSWRALPALSPAERVELMVSVMGGVQPYLKTSMGCMCRGSAGSRITPPHWLLFRVATSL